MNGRVLAVDLGARRVGLAVSDPTGTIAQPFRVLHRRSTREVLDAIAEVVAQLGPSRVVVGLPRNMDGTEGRMARAARRFGEALARRTRVPVEFWDERLTTVAAERVLRGRVPTRRRELRDGVAAALILEGYLRHSGPGLATP
ncbi:MAG: Holliday junction resolvase RuvX [Armatimonadota bacterium]|nr:Holliday junction resolvase RuvX [Armatimonadota bacterium]MDR7439171.1 Holliday junction resolvase RuvX [Armatimonadota bacterium]MDR7563810.1 Holliday junction resolvase RuvX [Armatimonadota bacterium]MDR7567783.1 Holliday junction resolvase RuvX [Armatimonadota bacterium]MDR7600880.1 Holliday junction resolvase RuvX [Armatimonadota bacterium]